MRVPFRCFAGPLALVGLLIVGCSSTQTSAPTATRSMSPTEARAAAADAVATGEVVTDEEVLRAAIDAGYDIALRDGERVYCRREKVFGTRVKERHICLTRSQLLRVYALTKDQMDDMSRAQIGLRPKDVGGGG